MSKNSSAFILKLNGTVTWGTGWPVIGKTLAHVQHVRAVKLAKRFQAEISRQANEAKASCLLKTLPPTPKATTGYLPSLEESKA